MSLAERYADRLPKGPIVSLGEGGTPLLRAKRISERLGLEVWLKWEGANPTGSFKDRGMTIAVSQALASGVEAVICASTGNTAASAAAYAARAGLRAVVLQPAGAVALGKLAQARAVGARVLEVRGSFDDALQAARELAARGTHVFVNSGYNEHRIQGQKTAAFEVVEQLGSTPDAVLLPYGGGGNTKAYALGFGELGAIPPLYPVQAAERATTLGSAIRISKPVHVEEVERVLADSGGSVLTVSDEQIVAAWQALAREEGVFCEPASAAPLAALPSAGLAAGSRVVCVVTGHGLKDPEAVARTAPATVQVDADPDAIAAACA